MDLHDTTYGTLLLQDLAENQVSFASSSTESLALTPSVKSAFDNCSLELSICGSKRYQWK